MGERVTSEDSAARRLIPPWFETAIRVTLTFFFLYLFLVGIKALENGISHFGSDAVDDIFGRVATPLAGLAAGILSTVLVQSSSVTTATMVGLVGAGVLSFEAAVPMVMGANIGTTVTATLAALGHVRQGAYFERAFATATIHDYFNLLAVVVLLPLEVAFGVVSRVALVLADLFDGILPEVDSSEGFVRRALAAPVNMVAEALSSLGWEAATGWVLLMAGLALLFFSLWMITRQMKTVMSGRIESAINGILAKGAGVGALMVGMVVTVVVQSSSITTSILVPLAAAGVLTLANAYPVTLGANIGTTITAILASVATNSPEALAVAMAHLTFNVMGTLIFYPWAPLRRIPLRLATFTASIAVQRKSFVAAYVIGVFIILPLVLLFIA